MYNIYIISTYLHSYIFSICTYMRYCRLMHPSDPATPNSTGDLSKIQHLSAMDTVKGDSRDCFGKSSGDIYGVESPRIPRGQNKYHGYAVRGTPNCPLKSRTLSFLG